MVKALKTRYQISMLIALRIESLSPNSEEILSIIQMYIYYQRKYVKTIVITEVHVYLVDVRVVNTTMDFHVNLNRVLILYVL